MMGKHAKRLLWLLISKVTLLVGLGLLLVDPSMYTGGGLWSDAVGKTVCFMIMKTNSLSGLYCTFGSQYLKVF